MCIVFLCSCGNHISHEYDIQNQSYKHYVSDLGLKWINKIDDDIDEVIQKHSNNEIIYYFIDWNVNVKDNMDKNHIVNFVINKFENAGYEMIRYISAKEYIFRKTN